MITDLNNVQMGELTGQLELADVLGDAGTGMTEGYDAEGRLLDYEVGTAAAGTSSVSATALTDEVVPIPDDQRLNEIAIEVRTITEQTRGVLISAALSIGKLLLEAKNRVPHGRFGEWLAENVDYSERRAQDMMRLYEEYGQGTIPEAFAALDYSKAVALLSAPEAEREALAERASAEGLSVRALQAEVKRLKEAAAADQLTIAEMEAKAETDARAREEDAAAAKRALQQMESDVNVMRGTVAAAEQTAEALRKEKKAAKDAADLAARRAGDAVQRANDTQTKLTAAEARIRELESREPERVEVVPDEVAEELERLRVQASAAPRSEAVIKFRLALESLTAEFNRARAVADEIAKDDAERGAKSRRAIRTLCEKMIGVLESEGA